MTFVKALINSHFFLAWLLLGCFTDTTEPNRQEWRTGKLRLRFIHASWG